jgi:transcriptional regulator with XRE-family HTH domain
MNTQTKTDDWMGAWIRDARKYSGMSQEILGEHMSLSKGNISAWENNRHAPSIQQVIKISEITGYALPEQLLQHFPDADRRHSLFQVPYVRSAPSVSDQALEVARAFDRLENASHKALILAQLEALGAFGGKK